MRLLLDTHIVVWWFTGDARLDPVLRVALESDDHELYLSSVVAIELAIKAALGKVKSGWDFTPADALDWLSARAEPIPLPITAEHGLKLLDLPVHHRDPFDRLLVVQAMVEGLLLVTADPKLTLYDVPRLT